MLYYIQFFKRPKLDCYSDSYKYTDTDFMSDIRFFGFHRETNVHVRETKTILEKCP